MLKAEILRALVEAGASAEMIVSAVEASQRSDDERRAKRRAGATVRQRRRRERASGDLFIQPAVEEQAKPQTYHQPYVAETGVKVVAVLEGMGPQADDAAELHDAAEDALRQAGLDVQREFRINLDDGSYGLIDLVVNNVVAIELDRRLPRAKSLRKLAAFRGFKVAVVRNDHAAVEFEAMVDRVVSVSPILDDAPDVTHVTPSHGVTERKVSTPSKERITSSLRSEVDQHHRRRARPLVSPRSIEIVNLVMRLAGIETEFRPPGWVGAPYRVETVWLAEGWTDAQIAAGVETAIARKRDGPPDSIHYFEKPIRRMIAANSAPLPNVVEIRPEVQNAREYRGNYQDRGGIHPIAAAEERACARLDKIIERARGRPS